MDIKKETITNNKSVKIQAEDELYNLLNYHTNTPYYIDDKQFKDFIMILEFMLLEKEKIIDLQTVSEEVFAIINAFYGIDCRLLRENNKNKELVLEIIKYGLAIESYYDKSLMIKVKVMSSYKYIITGMTNDLNLYKKFGHFFIDKYVTQQVEYLVVHISCKCRVIK